MNKQELIKKMAADAEITQKQAAAALESMIKNIEATVADGKKVSLVGFGTFEAKQREARTSRNPRTGEPVEVAASTVPAFKAGKEFKNKVNG